MESNLLVSSLCVARLFPVFDSNLTSCLQILLTNHYDVKSGCTYSKLFLNKITWYYLRQLSNISLLYIFYAVDLPSGHGLSLLLPTGV